MTRSEAVVNEMMKVTLLVGNPKPRSRTLAVARTVVEKLLRPGTFTLNVVDLAEYTDQLFQWPSEAMALIGREVAASDLLVVASPTYKASYTGLLKSFLDRYPHNGLQGVTTIPVMTGAELAHSLAPDVSLRPLLLELGADLPTKSLFFLAHHMDRMDSIVGTWAEQNRAALNLRPARSTENPNVAVMKSYPGIPVGIERGFFSGMFGTDIRAMKVANIESAAEGVHALAVGHEDLAVTGYDPAPLLTTTNVRAVAIAEASPSTQAALVSSTSRIRGVADLRGKTIGSFTPWPTAFISVVLAQARLGLDDINYLQISNETGAVALASGAIDVWVTFDPYFAQAQLKGIARVLVSGADVAYLNAVPIYVNDAYLAENRDAVGSFLRSYKSATDWVNSNPDGAARIMSAVTGIPLPVSQLTIRRRRYFLDPVLGMHRSWLDAYNRTSVNLGTASGIPDMDSIIDNTVYAEAFGHVA